MEDIGTGSDDCIVIGEGTNGCSSSSTSISSSTTHHPSRLAEILAHKVKIKQEKIHSTSHAMMYMPPSAAAAAASLFHGTSTTSTHAMMNPHQLQQHQQAQHFLLQQQQHYQQGQFMQHVQNEQEADLVPKSNQDFQIVSQLRQMGFNNNDREIMVALRAIEKKRNMVSTSINVMDTNLINSFIDDIMLYIVTQREEQNEARKMDIAREQSEAIVAQEQLMHKSSMNQIYQSLSIQELIGNPSENNNNNNVNTSQYFPTSSILKSSKAKLQFKLMMEYCDDPSNHIHTARMKIINLLTLEQKAYKWFGDKIPHGYFGIKIPEIISKWDIPNKSINNDDNVKIQNDEQRLLMLLQNEIEIIENAMYSLTEQVEGDLGLMIPKKFIEARDDAISKGLISDPTKKNDVIVLDDD